MSNINDNETLEMIYEDVLADDEKGLLVDEIDNIAYLYKLHADDDREEILEFIAESIFYKQFTWGDKMDRDDLINFAILGILVTALLITSLGG